MTQDVTWTGPMSEVYDRALGPVIFEPYAQRLAQIAGGLRSARVLELAAGTGIVTRRLVDSLPSADLTATDLNDGMVAYGKGQLPGVTWQAADAQDLPFPDATFDLVVCQFGVMFFPDKVRAFTEMARVLEPGGVALLAIWDGVEHSRFAAALMESLAVVLPEDPPSFVVRIPHGYTDTEQIRADISGSGLEVTSLERVVEVSSAPSASSVAVGFCQGTPLRFALEPRGDLAQLTSEVGEAMTERLGVGPISGEMAAFVVTARKA